MGCISAKSKLFCVRFAPSLQSDLSEFMPKERNKADGYREKAYEGDTKAMNNLGVCYERGTGVKVCLELAFEWYMKAAELGDVYGCFCSRRLMSPMPTISAMAQCWIIRKPSCGIVKQLFKVMSRARKTAAWPIGTATVLRKICRSAFLGMSWRPTVAMPMHSSLQAVF